MIKVTLSWMGIEKMAYSDSSDDKSGLAFWSFLALFLKAEIFFAETIFERSVPSNSQLIYLAQKLLDC